MADLEYIRILHLAATTMQCEVEAVLGALLEEGRVPEHAEVAARVGAWHAPGVSRSEGGGARLGTVRHAARRRGGGPMSTETLDLRLKAFRLPAFLSHYAPLADQAAQGGWSHIHYLDELAALEAVERTERRIARLLRESSSRATRRWPRWTWGVSPRRYVPRSRAWPRGTSSRARPICACSAIRAPARPTSSRRWATSWCARAHSVLFTPVSDLVERLLQAKRDLRLSRSCAGWTASSA